jgi:hypothetical protein
MAPTRVSADVLAAAHRDGVKVVALGDSGQLSSVEAGGWLGALSNRLDAHELQAVVRQRDPAERTALADLREADRWIELKRLRGDLVVHHGGPQAAQDAAMAAWRADVEDVGIAQAIMIVRDNPTRAELNGEAWLARRPWQARRADRGWGHRGGGWGPGDRATERPRARRRQRPPAAPSAPSTRTRRRSRFRPTPAGSAGCQRTTSRSILSTPMR